MGDKVKERDRYKIGNESGSIGAESGSIGAGRRTDTDRLHPCPAYARALFDHLIEHLKVIGSKQGNLEMVTWDVFFVWERFPH